MIFEPHKPYQHYVMPMFIIQANDRQVTLVSEIGDLVCENLESLVTSKRVIYSCVTPDTLMLYGYESLWTVRTWNGKISSLSYGTVKIFPLEMSFHDSLWDFFLFLDSLGIAASGLNRMALNLWKVTLPNSVDFTEVTSDSNSSSFLGLASVAIGGRKEAHPGVYRKRVEYDITAAYPNALGIGVPIKMVPTRFRSTPNSDWDGIGQARVRVAARKWGPLPIVIDSATQLTCYGSTGKDRWVNVTLPLSELRMAQRFGTDVEFDSVSVGIPPKWNAFTDWLEQIVPTLRVLPGHAGTLGKLVANRLWSNFAVTPLGERVETTFKDGIPIQRRLPNDHPRIIRQRSEVAYIGALVQSRVRERVYVEGLGRIPDCVYVDTDGVIGRHTENIPQGWRAKTRMRSLEIAGPQAYRYKCDQCLQPPYGHSGPHWSVAGGATLQEKSRLFRLMKNNGIIVANINNVVPNQNVGNFDARAETNKSEAFAIFAET